METSTQLCSRSVQFSFRHTYIFVCATIIKEVTVALLDHALNKYNIGDLPFFFPVEFWRKDRLVAAPKQLSRITLGENRDPGAIYQFIVGTVIDEKNAVTRDNGSRPRLDHPRIKFSSSRRKYRGRGRFRPVKQVSRIGEPSLVPFIAAGSEEVHP